MSGELNEEPAETPSTLHNNGHVGSNTACFEPKDAATAMTDESELVPLADLPLRHITSVLAPEDIPLETSKSLCSLTMAEPPNIRLSGRLCPQRPVKGGRSCLFFPQSTKSGCTTSSETSQAGSAAL